MNRHRSQPGLDLIALTWPVWIREPWRQCSVGAGRLRRAVGIPVLVVRAVCGLVGGGMNIFTTRVPAFDLAWAAGRMGIGKLPKPRRIPFG
ncbi:uncharacterized protein PHALS_05381 [Plasmopara halstedii]|uniref:Uncharacterized protein n=1 Tax=Plasmopara halstedii TaxID=4781 RepID=A0A0P1AAB3_PLAHL|nr:uncharacterized protein PHALS_05381 [Plasmopara halstedii]CEG37602.1 hypothetical protein PHALS_05381 [Plasmopara halstedii]|eukprot:XP_024573971.1 hypothetical protein PHALS_05381 [Plasmopara halstedii]